MNRGDKAREAIIRMGGLKAASEKLTAMTGQHIGYESVKKWRVRGVPARLVPAVAIASGMAESDLHPLFGVRSSAA